MPSKLPINLADLLRQRTVEGVRIEYKAGWNPESVLHTLCAFANDFYNLGGGYLVIGQDWSAINAVFTRSKPTERVPS
jgi:ATP-dependent DNA helicase RecG